jgi:hypothetical protein
MFERRNAEGVYHFQPRVARGSALPWVIKAKIGPTLKGLRKIHDRTDSYIRELFQSSPGYAFAFPRARCPGLEFANAFSVHKSHQRIPPGFTRRYATHFATNPNPALKGRAKVSRRYAAKATARFNIAYLTKSIAEEDEKKYCHTTSVVGIAPLPGTGHRSTLCLRAIL